MIIHNPILTGSFSVNGADLSTITGSVATSASFDARTTYLESTSSILTAASASQSVTSGSLVAASASLSATSGSLSAASASFNSRTTNLETYTTNWTAVSASFARTGSNNFRAPQYVSDTTVPTGFSNTTASIYTDGGLQVTKDSYFSGSMFIKGNLTIYGTQSVAYITSSQLNIATNVITVNTATPSVRFGGLNVYDSGSTGTGATGSLFWDSQNNGWVYQRESGSTYSGGMLISGPRRALGTNLGDEQGLTACMIPVAQGGDHITSSLIYHDSSVTCIPGAFLASGCIGIGINTPQSLLHVASGANVWSLNAGCACTPYNTNSAGFYTNAGNISLTNQFGTINWPEDYTTPSTAKPWWLLGNRSGTAGQWQLTLRTGYSGGGGLDREVIGVYSTGTDTARTIACIRLSTGAGVEALKIDSAGTATFAGSATFGGTVGATSWFTTNYGYFTHGSTGQDWLARTNNTTGNYEIVDWSSTVARVSIAASGIATFACTVCGGVVITAPTISAGSPTNSRIVANSNTMYGYYDVEVNPRWTLGRDVWAGGSGGLAFGLGNTSTCYSMIGDPGGYGCTLGFAILVPNGSSGTTYEKMRLTTTGLGIGTCNPTNILHLCKSSGNISLTLQTGGNYGYLYNDGTNIGLASDIGSTGLKFIVNRSAPDNSMTITSGGLVGINTASPFNFGSNSGMLDVRAQNTTSVAGVFISNSNASARIVNYINPSAQAFIGTSTAHDVDLGTSDVSRIRITSGGNIGVGTTTPGSSWMMVKPYSGGCDPGESLLSVVLGDTATLGSALLTIKNGGNRGSSTNGSGTALFRADFTDATAMIIGKNGFTGIATSTPKAQLDVACGNAHGIISTWCKQASNGTMYNGFDIYMDEASFAGTLYIQANGGGIGIQATYDILASYDRICAILRNSMNRGQGESLTIPSYAVGGGSKRICIQQNNGAAAVMNISAMLVGTAYGGTYICAQA